MSLPPPPSSTTVVVTGATGFIARHVVVQLLDRGYTVRGTARSASALDSLRAELSPFVAEPDSLARLSIVTADLTADAGWAAAVDGAAYVHHVASPFPTVPPKNPDDLIGPARDGTLRVLRAARDAGARRVVLTSSVAAILYGVERTGKVFTEADWSDPDGPRIGAYERSKAIAERAAWSFLAADGGELELATVNPGLVLGPLYGPATSTSHAAVTKLLGREVPGCPNFTYSMVDVRDVAEAHLAAMTSPAAAGERFLCARDSVSFREVAAILAREYGPRGLRIPTAKLPDVAVRLVALFDKTAALALNDLGNPQRVDPAKVTALLGRPLRSVEEMTLATAESVLAYGLVKRPRTGSRAR
jgi:dihydroflavonol-4-reductase